MPVLAALWPVLAGLAAASGQAPWGLWWLAFAGYLVGIGYIARSGHPFRAGLLFGMAHFALALVWIVEPFLIDPEATAWLAPVALVGVSVGFGLFWAVAGWVGVRWLDGAVGVAVALGLVELLRSYVLSGFPWALPGHVLIDTGALPAASLVGAHGLGIAVLLGAGLIATGRIAGVGAGAALWALPFAVGASLPPAPEGAGPVLRLVQPNAPQHLKWDPDWRGVFFRRGLEETAAAPEGAPPVAVVWPETALPEVLDYADDLRPILADAAGGVPFLIGVQRYGPQGHPRNSVALLESASGEIAAVHDKHRLVPFGEFLPAQGLFDLAGIGPLATRLAGTFAPGDGPALLDVPGVGPVLPLICYEAIFPQDIARVARPRAILHLTNDAWFGRRFGPQQHLALARLRAAESGLPVLRAANTGISASIDARGTVRASLPLQVSGHLDAAVPLALPPTPYLATGDWAALLLLSLLAACCLLVSRRIGVVRLPVRP
ncbi:apolipoprotein N-acyltransferase [uncultured Jannaschia sp.]|uniref:apolipoprotein N-acyltransferase n=1 Tax=uncultured Jannaschia sp. TaxID=293347 RepID=UPI0026041758|nr:apolipoprotein N-acyltransferase [uncultured Jannaschia sp.]